VIRVICLCALALPSISETEMKDFCEHLDKAIEHAPNSEVAEQLRKLREECGTVSTNADSGGGGGKNPPPPGG
jgi:hypothetical protein